MSISEEDVSGTEVIIQGDQGVEVQVLKSYGVGLDVHSQFIAVCVHVRNNNRVYKYMSDFDTDWNSLLSAKEWVIDTIKTHSAPVPDLSHPLHYVLEATSTYHMPVLRAWGGIPSVINPMLAGATKKKTDDLDAERLSFHDLTGVWPESFVASDGLSELRVLIAERNHYAKLATQCSNRINNIIVRFGITIGRGTSVTKNHEVRAIVEDLASENPSNYENICPDPLPAEVKTLIQKEYKLYDKYIDEADSYMSRVRHRAYSMDWETRDGTLSGPEMVRILCTTPGVGEITCFTWLAFVGTPRRFPNAKALAAYCGLDPSLKVSAGHVTSTKKRGGCRTLHAILVTSADRIIRAHSEAFGRWGYLMAKSSGKWKKATNAVGRKLCTAMYHMMMTGKEFSYNNYTLMQQVSTFEIPVDELPMLNPDFKRYIKILHENGIHTTTDMVTAYLSCSLGGTKGLGRKFFVTIQDFLQRQHHYHNEYKKLKST
jgi:transposase